jgi:AraC family transcriptional regulator of adaptative response / DNA-3-methyladenine glycosylase II
MELDHDICYRAVRSRDTRFDGRFFTGVTSTGVFCRPVCPAPVPRPENCRFFAHAAAALEAGFRPCLRCRPEAAPGSPAWQGVSASFSRAMRLIGEGYLDTHGVEQLAGRLGLGSRHLRRLFLRHVGASPKTVASSRRLLFAKKLISETALPLTDVALAAGFGSVRRFNAAFRAVYGRPPRAFRRRDASAGSLTGGIMLKLAYIPPFDREHMIGFLRQRAVSGLEEVTGDCYRRTITIDGAQGIMEARFDENADLLLLKLDLSSLRPLQEVVRRAGQIFDLGVNSGQIAAHLGRDPLLAPLVRRRPGIRVPGAFDLFELCVRAILGQQVSVAAGVTLAARLVERFGERLPVPSGSLVRLFPRPAALADADISAIGLPSRRARAVASLARHYEKLVRELDEAVSLSEAEKILCRLDGIGPWTAHYIAMRGLNEPDAFPASDLVLLKKAAAQDPGLTLKNLPGRAEHWRPWRAYAAMQLWAAGTDEPFKDTKTT